MTRREGVFIELVNQAMEKPLAAQPFAGEVLGPPAYEGVARYSVRVTGTDIEVEV